MKKTPPSLVVQLVHISGTLPLNGKVLICTEPEILIGRYNDYTLQFPKDEVLVSRKHAVIQREGNRFKLTDYSKNGTFVNGKKVTKEAYITNGDTLMFAQGGPVIAFMVSSPKGPEKDKIAPHIPSQRDRENAVQKTGEESQRPTPIPQKPLSVLKEADEYSFRIEHNFRITTLPFGNYGPSVKSFNKLPITVGKNPGCDFIIMRPPILDEHIQIFYLQKKYWLKDLTGQSLVVINQTPVQNESALESDDIIALTSEGPFFRYRFISSNNAILNEIEESFPQQEEDISAPKEPLHEEDEESEDKTKDLSFFSKIKGLWKE